MTTEIIVPELGESVLEATVGQWQMEQGDPVEIGDVLVNLETDKVDVEIGAQTAGVLESIERETGQDVAVGDVLGTIDEDSAGSARADARDLKTEEELAERSDSGAEGQEGKTKETQGARPARRQEITPVAKRFAEEHQIDLGQLSKHSGNGRITKEKVETYLAEQRAETAEEKWESTEDEAAAMAVEMESQRPEERQKMSRRRRTIAQRMLEAQQKTASLTTFNDISLKSVIELRRSRQGEFVERHGFKLGFTSFFVKAAVAALKAFPRLNGEIEGDEIVLKHYYDIGIAVGAEKGLVVPVIRDTDRKSVAEIEEAIRALAGKARDNSLSLEDLRGGTFTITNGGVFGSLLSTPILNPPQVGILGLHRIEDRPIALDGEVVIHPMMYVALSYDHRMVDGREAVQFLARIKELIEDPDMLLLEG